MTPYRKPGLDLRDDRKDELLIDRVEDRTLRAVLVDMLLEVPSHPVQPKNQVSFEPSRPLRTQWETATATTVTR
jgi:hypothetical protein